MTFARYVPAVLALLGAASPVQASTPQPVNVSVAGVYTVTGQDTRINNGTFEATGAINDAGSTYDEDTLYGEAVHVDRTMTTFAGDTIFVEINANHASGSHQWPDWCPIPPPVDGTTEAQVVGHFQIDSGTGQYSGVTGNGEVAVTVYLDNNSGLPLNSVECDKGKAQFK